MTAIAGFPIDAFLDDVETTLGASWQKLRSLQARLGIE